MVFNYYECFFLDFYKTIPLKYRKYRFTSTLDIRMTTTLEIYFWLQKVLYVWSRSKTKLGSTCFARYNSFLLVRSGSRLAVKYVSLMIWKPYSQYSVRYRHLLLGNKIINTLKTRAELQQNITCKPWKQFAQPAFTCAKLTTETLEQGAKQVKS